LDRIRLEYGADGPGPSRASEGAAGGREDDHTDDTLSSFVRQPSPDVAYPKRDICGVKYITIY